MTYFPERFTLTHNFNFATDQDSRHKIPAASSTLAGLAWTSSLTSITNGEVDGASAVCHTSNTQPYSLVIPYNCKLVRSAYSFMMFTAVEEFNMYWWKSDKDGESKDNATVWTLVDFKTCKASGADVNFAASTWKSGALNHTSAVTFAAGDDFLWSTKRIQGEASKTCRGSITHVFELLKI